jgi:hypothetical protein
MSMVRITYTPLLFTNKFTIFKKKSSFFSSCKNDPFDDTSKLARAILFRINIE